MNSLNSIYRYGKLQMLYKVEPCNTVYARWKATKQFLF